jgi:4-methylaminobutanoate oxidase (formaldehyde-forming)
MGPSARDILAAVTDADLSNETLPFGSVTEIDCADFSVRALRVTFVGELGWELHVPLAHATDLYDRLVRAGAEYGIVNAGYRAIETLRLEKGYRVWPAEVGPDHTPLEAGLGWAAKLKTDIPFLGREALEQQKADGLKKKLACFVVDDPSVRLWGRETIFRNGEPVGWLASAGYGHSVEKWIGYGYVRCAEGVNKAYLEAGEYELEVATERVAARLHFGSLHDPKGRNIRG